MNTITDLNYFIKERHLDEVSHFLISYIGQYRAETTNTYLEILEVSYSIDEKGEFWSRPVKFISDGASEQTLADRIRKRHGENIVVSCEMNDKHLDG